MTGHHDEMRVSPDHTQAEALRQRLHTRMTSVSRDDHDRRPLLRHDVLRLDPEQHLVPIKEMYVTVDSPTSETRNRRRLLIGAAAVVVVIGVAGIALVNNNTDDDQTPSPPVATAAPTTTVAPPMDVAVGFLDAYGAFDADRALTYLTADAVAEMSGSAAGANTQEEFRLELALLEASGYEHTITGCELPGDSAFGTGVRCGYDFHGIRSDEIGLGPYSDNYWDLTVRDGKIVAAANTIAFMTNGFSEQVWEPFADWVATTYPDDVPKMYTGVRTNFQLTEESVQLWDQRSREYALEVMQGTETGTSP